MPYSFWQEKKIYFYTRAVLVFATERKNNVDPRLRAQKKVNYVQLFLPSNWCTFDVSNIYE